MSIKNISILDHGSGNLLSIKRAFEYCGANVRIIKDSNEIKKSDRLVLPGVGAFATSMNPIKNKKFLSPIIDFVNYERPLLGICLGMQMFATRSYEFGISLGLNFVPGEVVKITNTNDSNK